MVMSLLNMMLADKVNALLDEVEDGYPLDVERGCSREKAAAIIHAALWCRSSRADATAAAYATMALFEAIGIKCWTFDEEEAAEMRAVQEQRYARRHAVEARPE
jgi:hypothetical protein